MEFIYKVTNPKGDIYIGKSKDPLRRAREYKYLKCKYQPRLYNSIKKYSWDLHKFEIILRTDRPVESEIKLIEFFNSYHNGMNLTPGGEAPFFDEAIRLKMSLSRLGKPSLNKGIKMSEESRNLMSESARGNTKRRKKVRGLRNDEVLEFDSLTLASKHFTGKELPSSISEAIKYGRTTYGYNWEYSLN